MHKHNLSEGSKSNPRLAASKETTAINMVHISSDHQQATPSRPCNPAAASATQRTCSGPLSEDVEQFESAAPRDP